MKFYFSGCVTYRKITGLNILLRDEAKYSNVFGYKLDICKYK